MNEFFSHDRMKLISKRFHKIVKVGLLGLEHSEYINKTRWKTTELKNKLDDIFDEIINLMLFGSGENSMNKMKNGMNFTHVFRKARLLNKNTITKML